MTKNESKKIISLHTLKYLKSNMIIGIGTGTTVSFFIENLKKIKTQIKGVVCSSYYSTYKSIKLGIPIIDSNQIKSIDIYIDGTDEFDKNLMLIKGGKGALTKEKILASIAKTFIVISDYSKKVDMLGKFFLPIEVIPMARSYVNTKIKQLGGIPKYRKNVTTDNGNIIIDVYNLKITNPIKYENIINSIPGVVTVGIFANRKADILITYKNNKIKEIT